MRIAIVTDAWHPQVNGVVRTLSMTAAELERRGHAVRLVTPQEFRTWPCPTYPEIRLALGAGREVGGKLAAFAPDALHVATEGPLGHAARRWAMQGGMPFTSAFHTQFPEYIRLRVPLPVGLTYAWLRRFHTAAVRTMVPTPSQRAKLEARGFSRLCLWPRGVDTQVFHPADPVAYGLPRPLLVYMGRVATEKNIEAFLALDHPGSKLVIGDGPALARLRQAYPAAHFLGALSGRDLARHLAGADVFVFPSRTDTFGVVLLEAMACGLPVAAYPVQGPLDVVRHGETGVLDADLARAVAGALTLDRADTVAYAAEHTWARATDLFEQHLAPRAAALP